MEAADAPMQPQLGGEEEGKKVDNITKRKKILPRELRIKMYNDVRKLRKRGLSHTKIRKEIYRKYGVWIGAETIRRWLRRLSSPYNGSRIPSLELLKPSKDLAYVIGVRLGDGYTRESKVGYYIGLGAKDREFVEEFATSLAKVLGREKLRLWKVAGKYVVEIICKTLYELLKKPVDLKRIKPYVEHCPKCAAAFLRGLFDSEGCVDKKGQITLSNSNYEVLVYAQKLLWRYFGIEATGPWPAKKKGTIIYSSKGKRSVAKEDCYYIYIRAKSAGLFYRHIGFTIRRKQKRLEEYLRRTGKL